jgi:hypothetical protein
MFNFKAPVVLLVAALALGVGSTLIASQSYAAVPQHASSQLDQVASAN